MPERVTLHAANNPADSTRHSIFKVTGAGIASRIGRQYRFSKDLVDAWLKERLIMPQETQMALFDKSGE